MRTLLFTGTALLALFTAAAVNAAPIFSDDTPGSASTTLAPGTYEIVAIGGSGGGDSFAGNAGGLGAEVEGAFTVTFTEALSILVGGAGANNSGGGGGGGSFVVGPGGTPLLIAVSVW